MKIHKEIKHRMELELRQYWKNKEKLQRLNQNSSTRSILLCQERIEYIENVIKQLKPFELEVFNYIFKDGCNALYCEMNYHISKSTYYNVYNRVIELLSREWGEI